MCTSFKVLAKDNEQLTGVAIGRSQEFGNDMSTSLFFRAKGHLYDQDITGNLTTVFNLQMRDEIKNTYQFNWIGQYGFVAFNSLDFVNAVTDGMNTAGLCIASQLLNDTKLDAVTEPKKGLLAIFFANWVLSSFATCEEVSDAINSNQVQISSPLIKGKKFNQHYAIHDATGQSLVIEFIDGIPRIYTNNNIGVLTNDPTFDWQEINMRNYVAITPLNTETAFSGNEPKAVTNVSEGSGLSHLPGGYLPPERFVRAATIANYAAPVTSAEQATNLAFHILNTFDIPNGIIRGPNDSTGEIENKDRTQYVTVSDLTRRIYAFRLYNSPLVRSVNLAQLETENQLVNLNGNYYPVPQAQQSVDITNDIITNKIPPLREHQNKAVNEQHAVNTLFKVF